MKLHEIKKELEEKKKAKELTNENVIEILAKVEELKCSLEKQTNHYDNKTKSLINSIPRNININQISTIDIKNRTKRFLSVFLGLCFLVTTSSLIYAFDVLKTRKTEQKEAFDNGMRFMGFAIYEKTEAVPKTRNWIKKEINNEYLFEE